MIEYKSRQVTESDDDDGFPALGTGSITTLDMTEGEKKKVAKQVKTRARFGFHAKETSEN